MSDSQISIPNSADAIRSGERGLNLTSFAEMARFARMAVNSGLVPKSLATPEAALLAMQMGMEVGLSPSQALQNIAVINGRPTMWGDACLALAKGRPDFVDCIETWTGDGDKMEAHCLIKRAGRTDLARSFSVTDAKRAGLWGKAGPWCQYPKRMLQMRARSWALRDSFPDALKGIEITEEIRDLPAPMERVAMQLPNDPPRTLCEPAPAPEIAAEAEPIQPSDNDGGLSETDLPWPS